MKLTLIAHAAVLLEHGDTTVLVDPWLAGTCYAGAWALMPEPEDWIGRLSRPTAIVVSHEHPDHLHWPTLEALAARFGWDLPIVLPYTAVERAGPALAARGFSCVMALPLGRWRSLGPQVSVMAQSVRADDAVLIFRVGPYTVVDANDCQLEGRVLAWVARQAPSPDVYLGQFSIADGYPACLDGLSPEESEAARWGPWQRFWRQGTALGARHLIPAASFARFSHADNQGVNRLALGLDDIARAAAGDGRLAVLYPGDTWTPDGVLADSCHRLRYERALEDVRAGRAPLSAREPVPERSELEAAAGERFADMLRAIPSPVRRRMGRLGFHLDDAGLGLLVDWPAGRVEWFSGVPPAPFLRLGAGYFAWVCRHRWGWADLHISARFTVHGWRDSPAVSTFLPVSILYGLGYLDLWRGGWLRPRILRALWARRAELLDVLARVRSGDPERAGGFPRL
jgi:hypothetical protein